MKDLFNEHVNEHVSRSMNMICVRMIMIRVHKCNRRNFRLFLGTGGGRCLCSMADPRWLSVINRSTTDCIGLIAPLQIV